MMKMTRHLIIVMALLMIASVCAYAAPFYAGSELKNWDFSSGIYQLDPGSTTHYDWFPTDWFQDPNRMPVKMIPEGNISGNPGVGTAVCRVPTAPLYDNHFRQVVDDTVSPLWDPNGTSKIVDLTLDVGNRRGPNSVQGIASGVRVRLDWWTVGNDDSQGPGQDPVGATGQWATGMTWNRVGGNFFIVDPTVGTTTDTLSSDGGDITAFANGNYHWTEWEYMTFDDASQTADTWVREWNPFNRMSIDDFQPRWMSVEVEWLQPYNYNIAIDNVRLTSQCVPEIPAVLLAPLGLAAFGVIRRKYAK